MIDELLLEAGTNDCQKKERMTTDLRNRLGAFGFFLNLDFLFLAFTGPFFFAAAAAAAAIGGGLDLLLL